MKLKGWKARRGMRRQKRLAGVVYRPDKRSFEVYVTMNGKCYHPFWCAAVNGVWLSGSNALQVLSLEAAEAGLYEMCQLCDQGAL